jgi:RHS repeat-associated protein
MHFLSVFRRFTVVFIVFCLLLESVAVPVVFALETSGSATIDSEQVLSRKVNTRQKPQSRRAPDSVAVPESEPPIPDPSPARRESPLQTADHVPNHASEFRPLAPSATVEQKPAQVMVSAGSLQQSGVDVATGMASLAFPLAVPKGVNGLTPSLGLSYSSQRQNVNGPFGFGWEVNLGSITRLNRFGIDSGAYQLDLPGMSGELVLIGSYSGYREYGMRRESAFSRIRYYIGSNSWTVETKDGMDYRFGYNDNGRFKGGVDNFVYGWQLQEIEDLHGNRIHYFYERVGNLLYPLTIGYGRLQNSGAYPLEVRFFWSDRTDEKVSYATGFKVDYTKMASRMEVKVSGTKRFEYRFRFLENGLGTRLDLNQLEIVGINASGNTVSQKVDFGYYSRSSGYIGSLADVEYLLRRVSYPGGLTLDYSYQQAFDFGGEFSNRYPFPMVSVSSVQFTDPFGPDKRVDYTYEDGFFYADPTDRQVAGYGRVWVEAGTGQRTLHFFHQGGGYDGLGRGEFTDHKDLAGRLYRQDRYHDQTLLGRTFTRWDRSDLGNERSFISKRYDLEQLGPFPGTVARATEYRYDSYGNVTSEIRYGDVSAPGYTGAFSDIGTDSYSIVSEYAAYSFEHLFGFVKRQQVWDKSNTLRAESKVYYDERDYGQVRKGDMTRVDLLLRYPGEADRWIITRASYDDWGNLLVLQNPKNNTVRYTYWDDKLYPRYVDNALNHRVETQFDIATGQLLRSIDANGAVHKSSYDGFGRVVFTRVSDPRPGRSGELLQSETVYDDVSSPRSILTRQHDYSVPDPIDSRSFLDGYGRVIQIRGEFDGGVTVRSTLYDVLGRVKKQFLPLDGVGIDSYQIPSASALATEKIYFTDGRLRRVTTPLGVTEIGYDGWKTTTLDALGNRKEAINDAFGRVVEIGEFEQQNRSRTQFVYSALGKLIKYIDADGYEKSFAYDSLGRLRQQEDLHVPSDNDFGLWLAEYDDTGNITRRIDPKGQVVTYWYDELDRVLGESWGGAPAVVYAYDEWANGVGRLWFVSHNNGLEYFYNYDKLGRRVREEYSVDGVRYETLSRYDLRGRLQQQTMPDGKVVEYPVDSTGRLEKVKYDGAELVERLDYNPTGLPERIDLGNDLTTTNEYPVQDMYRLKSRKTEPTSSVWDRFFDLLVPRAHAAEIPGDRPSYLEINGRGFSEGMEIGDTVTLSALYRDADVDRDAVGYQLQVWERGYSRPHHRFPVLVQTDEISLSIPASYGDRSEEIGWVLPNVLEAGKRYHVRMRFKKDDNSWTQWTKTDTGGSFRLGPFNTAPEFERMDSLTVFEGEEVVVSLLVSDAEGDEVTVEQDSFYFPRSARLVPLLAESSAGVYSGEFRWIPGYAAAGDHVVRFLARDSRGWERIGGFTIHVLEANAPPWLTIWNPGSVMENEEMEITVHAGDAYDQSAVVRLEVMSGLPSNAVVSTWSQAGTKYLRVRWSPGFFDAGNYRMVIEAEDDTGMVAIENLDMVVENVNRDPVLVSLGNVVIQENEDFSVDLQYTDEDSDDVHVLEAGLVGGLLLPEGMRLESGRLLWTPNFQQAGNYDVEVSVDDGRGGSDVESFSVEVRDVNRDPVLGVLDDQVVDENSELRFSVSATDADLDSLQISDDGLPNGATFASGDFFWIPGFDQSGTYQLRFTVRDGRGGSDEEMVQIRVDDVNRDPVLQLVTPFVVSEGEVLQYQFLANDADGDALSYRMDPPNRISALFSASTGELTWTPGYSLSGFYSFEVVVEDSRGGEDSVLVEIQVDDVNRDPVLLPVTNKTVQEGDELRFTLSATDLDGNALTFGAQDLRSAVLVGATFIWTPDFDAAGDYEFVFYVWDGFGGEDTVSTTITVTESNRAPVLNAIGGQSILEGEELVIVLSGSDVDGDSFVFGVSGEPVGSTWDGGDTFRWTPGYNDSGTYNVLFTISDGNGGVDEEVIVITVGDVNRNPVLDSIGTQQVIEGEEIVLRMSGSDRDGDSFVFGIINQPLGSVWDGSDTFRWTPSYSQAGAHTVIFTITDSNGAVDEESVSIVVANANRAPVFTDPGTQFLTVGVPLNFSISATDPDGDAVGVTMTGHPSNVAFTNRSVIWTPSRNQGNRDYWIVFHATDSNNETTHLGLWFRVRFDENAVLQTPTVIQELLYAYDAVGNVLRVEERANTSVKYTGVYGYNDLYQLVSAGISAVGSGPSYSRSFSYSAAGRFLNKSDVGTYVYSQQDKTSPQAVTTPGSWPDGDLAYDANGNLLGHRGWSFTWDYRDRLVRAEKGSMVIEYGYDYLDQRFRKKVTESGQVSQTLYLGAYEVLPDGETKSSVMADFGSGGGMKVATVRNRNGIRDVFYVHEDHLGGASVVTNSSGQLVQEMTFAPYGDIKVNERAGSFDERSKFTGKELDNETGLVYFGARYYVPELGIWASADPLRLRVQEWTGAVMRDVRAGNAYAYAVNNPLKYVDPDGECPVCLVAWVAVEIADAYFTAQDVKNAVENPSPENVAIVGVTLGTSKLPGNAIFSKVSRWGSKFFKRTKATTEFINTTPVKGLVENDKMKNLLDATYKESDMLPGGTPGATRHTFETGEHVGGTDHVIKSEDLIRGWNNLISDVTQNLSPAELNTAKREVYKLQEGLGRGLGDYMAPSVGTK